MSGLQIIDVFDSYYEGRKASVPIGVSEADLAAKRDEKKLRAKPAESVQPVAKAA